MTVAGNPPVKNNANGWVTYVSLLSFGTAGRFQANPTLAAGDVKVALDDGAPANITTLPTVDADFTKRVKVTLSQAEVNANVVTVIFSDQTDPPEWCDQAFTVHTQDSGVEGTTKANITHVNEVAVSGTGEDNDPWGPS